MDFRPGKAAKNNVVRRLRTLAQYQLALTAQHSERIDTEFVSDYYAQDLIQISTDVVEVVDEFLRQSGKSRGELSSDPEQRRETSSTLFKNVFRNLDLNTMMELVRTLSKVVEAYASYKNAEENAKFYKTLKEKNRIRSRKKRKYVKRKIHGEWVEYWESDSEADVTDETSRDKTKQDKVQKSDDESLVNMETVTKAVAASVAVGAGMQSFNYYSSMKQTNTELSKVVLSREGNNETMNGDLTNVAPLNTGRLMAEDAEGIIVDLQQNGIEVPLRLKYTAREIMSLVKEMHETLTEIEDCYELRQETEKINMTLTAATCLGALSFLLIPKSAVIRSALFYLPFSATSLYFLLKKVFHFNTWKESRQVITAREKAIKLCNRFDILSKERILRKQDISETADRVIKNREQDRNRNTDVFSGRLFPQVSQPEISEVRNTVQKTKIRKREPIPI